MAVTLRPLTSGVALQECELTSRQPVKHRYKMKEESRLVLPNLLNRQFNPTAPNLV